MFSLKFKKYHIFFLIILCLPVIWSFLKPGFFPIHDNQHVVRLYELDLALKDGQFPVRWVKDLGFGYGYPLFNFYPPFLYYLAELFHLFGFSYLWSIKSIFILSFILSALLMYLFAKDFLGRYGSFVASAFYLYLPYRAVDSYARGALAELLSFAWFPGLLWAGGRIFYLKKIKFKDIFYLGLFLFLLMTTHNLSMLIFAPFFLLWSLFFLIKTKKKEKILRLKLFFLGIMLGAGLSCFFWLPALTEKSFTLVNKILLDKLYNYQLHFIVPIQLWNSPFGYGGSLLGLDDGLSFQIGKVHLLVGFFAILKFIFLWLKGKDKRKIIVVFWAAFLFLGALFMSLSPSRTIWKLIKPIWYVQFPWRFLSIIGLFISFIAGSIVSFKNKKQNIFFTLLLLVLIIFVNKNYFKPQNYNLNLQDKGFISEENIKWDVSITSFEYVSSGVALKEIKDGLQYAPFISKDTIAKNRLDIVTETKDIKLIADKTHFLSFKTFSNEEFLINTNIFFFPGWKVYLDEKEISYLTDNNLQTISFTVPAGDHKVNVRFENTLIRNIANMVSLLSLFLIFLFFIINMTFNQKLILKEIIERKNI